jgi:hypothetical protein
MSRASHTAIAALLVACNNVALLLVSRAYERQRDDLIRIHLRASRLRLLFEVMAEGAWLCFLSSLGALAVAAAAWNLLGHILPALSRDSWLSSRSIAMLVGLALVSGGVTVLAPYLQVIPPAPRRSAASVPRSRPIAA